jgi:hypothetical protein
MCCCPSYTPRTQKHLLGFPFTFLATTMKVWTDCFFLIASMHLMCGYDAYQLSSTNRNDKLPEYRHNNNNPWVLHGDSPIPSDREPIHSVTSSSSSQKHVMSRRSLLRTSAAALSAGTLMETKTVRPADAATDDDVPLYFGVGVSTTGLSKWLVPGFYWSNALFVPYNGTHNKVITFCFLTFVVFLAYSTRIHRR